MRQPRSPAAAAGREATYQDLIEVPEHRIAELIDGELVVSPRPASPHAFAGSAIAADLLGPFQRGRGGPGGWWILYEPELHFSRNALVPDLAGWRRERMPVFLNVPAFELAPDWVCEIISPQSARHDRIRKMRLYAQQRVSHAWIVDPLVRTLEVYRLSEEGAWLYLAAFDGNDLVNAEPFAAIALELSNWWSIAEDASPGEG